MFKRGMVRPTGCNLCFLSPLKVFYFFKEKLFDFRLGIRLNKKRERWEADPKNNSAIPYWLLNYYNYITNYRCQVRT